MESDSLIEIRSASVSGIMGFAASSCRRNPQLYNLSFCESEIASVWPKIQSLLLLPAKFLAEHRIVRAVPKMRVLELISVADNAQQLNIGRMTVAFVRVHMTA